MQVTVVGQAWMVPREIVDWLPYQDHQDHQVWMEQMETRDCLVYLDKRESLAGHHSPLKASLDVMDCLDERVIQDWMVRHSMGTNTYVQTFGDGKIFGVI